MNTIKLAEKFQKFQEHWHPYIIGELNENYIKLAKLKGEFVWHHHEQEDELFIVIEGTLMMEFRDKTVQVKAGEVLVVPKGVEHRPWVPAGEEVKLMLIEPKSTAHTGNVITDQTVTTLDWI